MAQLGQPENEEIVSLLEVGPFGGLDTTTSSFYVSPNNFPDMLNMVPNDVYGGYSTALGRVAKGTLPSEAHGIHKFVRDGLPDVYLFAVDVAGAGAIYSGPLGGPYTALTLPVPLTAGQQTYFVDSLKWVFITNGVDRPIKIDLNLNVTYWGIIEPATAPTLTASGASQMNSTVISPYYYAITFGNADQESSQGKISLPIVVTDQGVQLSGIPLSNDPQVTERNIYRVGGSLGTWQLIHTFNDNTTTTYLDTLADANVTGQILVIFRDPPRPFKYITTHKERIWGWGTPTDPSIVYWSNINEPWAFNEETGNLPVGENSFADGAAGITSVGSVLVLNKRKSLYYVYGQTDSDFQAVKIADTGCLTPPVSIDGMAFWADRRGIWMSSGEAPQIVSDGGFQSSNVKNLLRSLSVLDIEESVGFWYDRMYHLSFPSINKTVFYDTRSQAWYALGWACRQVYVDPQSDQSVIADNQQSPGQVTQWFAAQNDLGQPVMAYIVSRVTDSGDSSSDKIFRYAELLAPPQAGICNLYVYANPGNQVYAENFQIPLSTGTNRHQIGLPSKLRGTEIQIKLQTYSSVQLFIQKLTVYGIVDRRLIEVSNAAASL